YRPAQHRHQRSFPTRRSSDLIAGRDKSDALGAAEKSPVQLLEEFDVRLEFGAENIDNVIFAGMGGSALAANLFLGWTSPNLPFRSEEHTSELQSRENLVCRLL